MSEFHKNVYPNDLISFINNHAIEGARISEENLQSFISTSNPNFDLGHSILVLLSASPFTKNNANDFILVINTFISIGTDKYLHSFIESQYLSDCIKLVQGFPNHNNYYEIKSIIISLFENSLLSCSSETLVEKQKIPNIGIIMEYCAYCISWNDNLSIGETACSFLQKLFQKLSHDFDSNNNETNNRIDGITTYLRVLFDCSNRYSQDSVTYLRFLSFFCRILSYNNQLFSICQSLGIVRIVFAQCRGNDILVQFNAIELLLDIAGTEQGMDCLCNEQMIYWLAMVSFGPVLTGQFASQITPLSQLTNVSIEYDPLLGDQAVRILSGIFAKASSLRFELTSKLDSRVLDAFLSTIMRLFEDGQEAQKLAGLAALSDFAKISYYSLNLVMSNEELVLAWLSLLNSSKHELASSTLHSIATIIDEPMSDDSDNLIIPSSSTTINNQSSSSSLKQKLFHKISSVKRGFPHTLAYLLKCVKQPLPLLRHSALDMLIALVGHMWGLLILFPNSNNSNNNSDFLDYLTDRVTEHSKEGKDWKFALIVRLSKSEHRAMLSDTVMNKVDLMVKQGAYFMPTRMEDMQTMEL
eukprot:gene9031-12177_t